MKARLIKHNTNKGAKYIKHILATRDTSIPEDADVPDYTERVVKITHRDDVYDAKIGKWVPNITVEKITVKSDPRHMVAGKRKAKKRGKPCRSNWKNNINKLQNPNCPYYGKSKATLVREPSTSERESYRPLTGFLKGS